MKKQKALVRKHSCVLLNKIKFGVNLQRVLFVISILSQPHSSFAWLRQLLVILYATAAASIATANADSLVPKNMLT